DVLVVRHPEIYEKIRDAVYEKFSDETDYFDEQKSNRSKYRLDFEIEYKTPLSSGGKTSPDNLKLVYKGSSLSNLAYKNMPLSEIKQKDSVLYKKICDAVYRNYQIRDGKYFDGQTPSKRSDDKDDFEIDYIKPLDKGGKTTLENLHLVHKDFSAPVSTTTNIPSTKSNGVPIPDTNLTWQLDDNTGTLTISGNGNMKDFPPNSFVIAHDKRDLIKKVIIEEGVTSIGGRAFEYCYSLQSVEFSKSVTEIAKEAFFYCKSLTKINLPVNLVTIGERAFRGCYRLEKVTFNSNLRQIDDEAFSACPYLEPVTLPQSLQKIGKEIFEGCNRLQEINYPRSLKDAEKLLGEGNNAKLIPY
ncbi:MAG: leucine-rich repeat protein, partial [Selenomonadaceae bacterium]|nr:leucine-rich repeat protein [Selenomonadaceae bacterium]